MDGYYGLDPLPIRTRKRGLLHQVEVVEPADPHWRNGGVWAPDLPLDGPNVASSECSTTHLLKPPSDALPFAKVRPFYVWRGGLCKPADPAEELADRVRRLYSRAESHDVEWTLWNGIPDPTDPLALSDPQGSAKLNFPYLSHPATTVIGGGVAQDPAAAFGLLMQALAGSGGGVIHAPLIIAPACIPEFVERTPEGLRTVDDGFEVILGHGYTGHGPGGVAAVAGTAWLYGTSEIRVIRDAEVQERSGVYVRPDYEAPADRMHLKDPAFSGQFRYHLLERTYLIQIESIVAVLANVRVP